MKRNLLFGLVLMLFIACEKQEECKTCIAFDDYTILDLERDAILNSHTVVINNGKIIDVLSSEEFKTRYKMPDSSIINGNGDYLMSSLNDMHVHLTPENPNHKKYLKDFLAYGVTGLRVMAGSESLLSYRDSINEGFFPGPDLRIAGPVIDGEHPMWGDHHKGPRVNNSSNVDSIVKAHKELGYDLIKLYERLPAEKFYELISAAQKNDIRVASHIPFKVLHETNLDSLFRSPIQSFEHFKNLGALITKDSVQIVELPKDNRYYGYELAKNIDNEKLSKVLYKVKEKEVWMVPTSALWCNREGNKYEDLIKSEEFERLDTGLKNWWTAIGSASELDEKVCEFNKHILMLMARQHIPVLAGTDFPNPMLIPGLSLHQELAYLVDAGYSNAEALKAATLNPAIYWEEESSGRIQAGAKANFILLTDNPLEDIANTLSVHTTVHQGKIFRKKDLLN